MKNLIKPILAAALVTTAALPVLEAPAVAQNVRGIGVVNVRAVIANSQAFTTAREQRPVTYKAQIDAANTRQAQIEAQLQPLVAKFTTDRQAATPNQASLQQQAQEIQRIQQAGEREIQQILQPIALSQAYVEEQITDQLNKAVEQAAKKKNITLIFDPTAGSPIYAAAEYNLNQDVLNELNTLLPNAILVPPQGWLPREMREQQEAAAQAQAPAAAQSTGEQPSSR